MDRVDIRNTSPLSPGEEFDYFIGEKVICDGTSDRMYVVCDLREQIDLTNLIPTPSGFVELSQVLATYKKAGKKVMTEVSPGWRCMEGVYTFYIPFSVSDRTELERAAERFGRKD